MGSESLVHLGPVTAPCRVVYVVDEPDRRGFAYGTLTGHPESGEELFTVRHDRRHRRGVCRGDGVLPARHLVEQAGRPLTWLGQQLITRRYLRAV